MTFALHLSAEAIMNTNWILNWVNLIYVLPFGMALLYLATYTLSGWTFGEADADHDIDADADFDADADVDIDADADVDLDADADLDHDVDLDHDIDADHDLSAEHDADHDAGGGSPVWAALSFLGVGTVPLSIILMILLLVWGGVGFMVNQIARDLIGENWQVVIYSLPMAAIASLAATSGTSRAIDRFMPLNLTFAKRRHELLGAVGQVVLPIDANFGLAAVRDDGGDLFQVPCRLEAGQTRIVPKGARVKLIGYSARETIFYVRAIESTIGA
jgi:hypothetical protein